MNFIRNNIDLKMQKKFVIIKCCINEYIDKDKKKRRKK